MLLDFTERNHPEHRLANAKSLPISLMLQLLTNILKYSHKFTSLSINAWNIKYAHSIWNVRSNSKEHLCTTKINIDLTQTEENVLIFRNSLQ